MKPLQTGIIITDCCDDNARVRQQARFMALFGVCPAFLGVKATSHKVRPAGDGALQQETAGHASDQIQAAGNLIDQLDAATSLPQTRQQGGNVILVNVAPRGKDKQRSHENGTPFCYFWVGQTLVASTYTEQVLSLAREFGLASEIELFDTREAVESAVAWDGLTPADVEKITHTQFRSLEFLPLVARWVYEGRTVPSTTVALDDLESLPGQIWFIDNFGNAKTTLLPEQIGFEEGRKLTLASGQVATCHRRLTDVPYGEIALTIGSSGYRDKRFVEIAIQQRNAAADLGLEIGDQVGLSGQHKR